MGLIREAIMEAALQEVAEGKSHREVSKGYNISLEERNKLGLGKNVKTAKHEITRNHDLDIGRIIAQVITPIEPLLFWCLHIISILQARMNYMYMQLYKK